MVVNDIDKNRREVVRVQWSEFQGKPYLDLRIYYREDGELKPTRKGVSLSPDKLRELILTLQAADEMREAGRARAA